MVDGLRYGMLGSSAFSPVVGGGILLALACVATAVVWALLRSGYKLKA